MFRYARASVNIGLYPLSREKWGCLRENCLGKMSGEKCLGKLSGRAWGRKECQDPENQFSFIRKTYKQLIFAIVQVVETFLNIRIRFQSDFNNDV